MSAQGVPQCPHCQQEFENDPELAGRLVSCPSCGGTVKMPPASKASQDAPLDFLKPAPGRTGAGGRLGGATNNLHSLADQGKNKPLMVGLVGAGAGFLVGVILGFAVGSGSGATGGSASRAASTSGDAATGAPESAAGGGDSRSMSKDAFRERWRSLPRIKATIVCDRDGAFLYGSPATKGQRGDYSAHFSTYVYVDDASRAFGKPLRTQTIGEKRYWYWQCQDGIVQVVLDVDNSTDAYKGDEESHWEFAKPGRIIGVKQINDY